MKLATEEFNALTYPLKAHIFWQPLNVLLKPVARILLRICGKDKEMLLNEATLHEEDNNGLVGNVVS